MEEKKLIEPRTKRRGEEIKKARKRGKSDGKETENEDKRRRRGRGREGYFL